MDCSTPALPVHHQLLELAQTHVHQVGDAIQPSQPLFPFSSCLQSFPASRAFLTSQLFTPVQFSRSVVSDSLQPHGLQHTRPPCPSPTAGVHPNPCLLNRCCHPTISSSVVPFYSCTQSFPASGSFQMSQLFASGGQSIAVSASTSVLPKNTQD